MNNMADIQKTLLTACSGLLKHHTIIMLLSVLATLIFTVYYVNQIITTSSDDAYRTEKQSTSIKTSFDTATIEKINRLRSQQQTDPLMLPSGRINPFVE